VTADLERKEKAEEYGVPSMPLHGSERGARATSKDGYKRNKILLVSSAQFRIPSHFTVAQSTALVNPGCEHFKQIEK
jgi:hypothetical protein